MRKLLVLSAAAVLFAAPASAQEREDRTLLGWDQMRAIINEASGERALHHLLELVPYQRVRPLSEYQGHFRESEVMVRLAREYGFSNVEIESFATGQPLWQPTTGQLWLVGPPAQKLFDIYDTPVALAGNTPTGDVTAPVVDVGSGGRAEDYAGKDVKGKVVLGSAGVGALQRLGVLERGAVGVLSYNTLRPDDQPDAMLSQSVGPAPAGQNPGFGWSISARAGRALVARLARGETIAVRSIVQAESSPAELEMVHATIPGDGTTAQDVIVSGHLYEGYIKQGANDDNSGCALTLEMGRAYLALVKAGLLPRPKRTIHFLWVPEISGTNAWLNAHKDIEARIIADLNFDMEGLRLSASGSFWVMHRTPDTFPTFLNDVGQSFIEFVAETNRERVRYRANGYGMSLPIVSANGSNDPFYVKVDKYYGASDHATYMQHGIPALMFITWPDYWYHSSQDTPDKIDPTQFKRAAVVGTGAMTVLATADDPMAGRVAAEVLGRGAERMGANQRKGLGYIGDAADAAALTAAYREARVAVRHQAALEKATIRTAKVLFADPAAAEKRLAAYDPLVDARANALLGEVTAAWRFAAATLGVPATDPVVSDQEKLAARTLVERGASAPAPGGFGGGGAGGRGAAPSRIPQHMTSELNALLNQRKTVLEIRDFLSGEFEPLPLADVLDFLKAREASGFVKLTEQPARK